MRARASQLPDVDVSFHEVLEPNNELGVKGIGEAGACGAPPALVNAVLQCTRAPRRCDHRYAADVREALARDKRKSYLVGLDKGFGHRSYLYFSWNYQRGNCKVLARPVKTLQYAAADLQGMDAVPRAKLGASRELASKNHAFCAANRGDSLKKSRTDFFRADYLVD